jgi:uracil-DNA glycosylase
MSAYRSALAKFFSDPASVGWRDLPFFAGGEAARIAAELDRRAAAGATVLPPSSDVFRAFRLTPSASVKVVILGQDPYPTPGHAHGLAFSCLAVKLPASLKRIYRELGEDLSIAPPSSGDLSQWARDGVLLLNTALSVEAGQAGSHLTLGWNALADEAISHVSEAAPAAVFILWGDKARAGRNLIAPRHLVIESAHPSPLAARGDFLGSRPFSRANAFLMQQGIAPVDWASV